jgi:DNA-binding LytR/AlgR family response regulator
MIRISIADDENSICSQTEHDLRQIAEELHIPVDIDVFYTGRQLCEHIRVGVIYDVIFLDIEMDDVNGLMASKYIRQIMQDDGVQIVYLSGKTQYALELFQYSPLDFLVKPVETKRLKQVMTKLIRILGLWTDSFSFKKGHDVFKIKMRDILYFESAGRKLIIHTNTGCDTFYGAMENVENQLKSLGFISIHRSYLVNYRHVRVFHYADVIMSNDDILPIGRSKRAEVQAFQMKLESGALYDN